MNEATRMEYLEAMGIEMFVPRHMLPAAKASVACELPIEWVDDVASNIDGTTLDITDAGNIANAGQMQPIRPNDSHLAQSQQAANIGANTAADQLPSSVMQSLLEPSAQKTATRQIADSALTLQQLVSQKPKKGLRFSLSVWSLNNGVVIMDTRSPQEALPTLALLQNIIKALDPNLLIPKADIIQWPLLESPVINPSEAEEASAMVQAFLSSRLEQLQLENTQPKLVVVMGETAVNTLLPPQEKACEVGQLYSLESMAVPVAVLPSLTECLKEPLLKRYIWPLLKPFF